MTQQLSDDTPGTSLFPQFGQIYDMVATEAAGLTDEQLDFESDRWGWSQWSIRRQVSHIASLQFRWLLGRWAQHGIIEGLPQPADAEALLQSNYDRRLDEERYWSIDALLGKVREAMKLCQAVLARETVKSLGAREMDRTVTPQWPQMARAHPHGTRLDSHDPTKAWMTLEATFRHMYFEDITHLYNIQRLKRAQGLNAKVELPQEGYWVLPDWDRSES